MSRVVTLGCLTALLGAGSAMAVDDGFDSSCGATWVLEGCTRIVTGYAGEVDLSDAPDPPTAIAGATGPAEADAYAFVAQGPLLRVVSALSTTAERTIDIGALAGLSALYLQNIESTGVVRVDDAGVEVEQRMLYLVGWDVGAGLTARFFVVDQEAALNPEHPGPILLAHGTLCADGADCMALGTDIAAYSPSEDPLEQHAYAVSLEWIDGGASPPTQVIHRIDRGGAVDGPWTTSVDSWNVDAEPYGAVTFPNFGVTFNRETGDGLGVFPTGQAVQNLVTGDRSCALDGYPTGVASWALDPVVYPNYSSSSYVFVPLHDVSGIGSLAAFPEGECPMPGATSSLDVPLSGNPTRIVLRQDLHGDFVIHVVVANQGVEVLKVRLTPGNGGEDTLTVEHHEIRAYTCATDVVVLEGSLCGSGNTDEPDPPRCADEDDPACPVRRPPQMN